MPLLFSYGTLRQPDVQRALFGRRIAETPARLTGWRLDTVAIGDARVVGLSGMATHPILNRGTPDDAIDGGALELTVAELRIADEYETDAYRRIEARLADGRKAFVYVAADGEDA